MSEKQVHFNFNIMVAPDFTDLDTLGDRITNKTEYLQEISKTKKELNQLGALLNSTSEDLVYDESENLIGVAVNIDDYKNTNSTISDVMDNDDYQGGDTYEKLLPPSSTAAFNKAILDLNDEADLLGMLSDIIGNDVFIQDIVNNPKEFVKNCEKVIKFLTKVVAALTSSGEGTALTESLKEGCQKVLKAVVGVALDKFDLDKIMNQIMGDKIDLVDQAITKYTAMDQTGLTGSLKTKYNISFRSLTSNIFKKTYSNIKDVSNKGFSDALVVKSTREAASEGIDKIFSEQFLTNVTNSVAEQAKRIYNTSKIGASVEAMKIMFTAWSEEAMCYKLYLIAAMANYALKNSLLDGAAAQALLIKVGRDFITSVLQGIGKAAETALTTTVGNKTTNSNRFAEVLDQKTNTADILGGTNEYYKDVYNFLQKVSTGSTYSSLTRYVDLFQRYALNNHNTGLKTLNVQDNEGVLQMFEYMKSEVSTNNSEDKGTITEQMDKVTSDVAGIENQKVISGLTGEVIDLNKCINSSVAAITNNETIDLITYINSSGYKPNYTTKTPDKNTTCWQLYSNQRNDSYETWSYSSDYVVGECVNYNDKVYKCIKTVSGTNLTTTVSNYNTNIINYSNKINTEAVKNTSTTITPKTINRGGTVTYIGADGTEQTYTNTMTTTFNVTRSTLLSNSTYTSNINNIKTNSNSIKTTFTAVSNDAKVYERVIKDYKETVKKNSIQAFYQQEEMITYKVDDPKQLAECINLHIKYRQQKLEKLAGMNRLYFAVKSE